MYNMRTLSFILLVSLSLSSVIAASASSTAPAAAASELSTEIEEENCDESVVRVRRVVPIMFSNRNILENEETVCSRSIDDFPNFFTDTQRAHGAIIIPFLVAIYSFTLIAIICDNYFLPCVQKICVTLNLSEDVAAAIFMPMATSAPELFSNVIGTFITESDIGIGTVVGSSMFNTLGVASIGGLAASSPILLDWWPLTRDTFIYICSVILLVWITWDGKVLWFEALILFMVYFVYLIVMFQNVRISTFFKALFKRFRNNKISEEPMKPPAELSSVRCIEDDIKRHTTQIQHISPIGEKKILENGNSKKDPNIFEVDEELQLFKFPKGPWTAVAFFLYTWPIRFVLLCTVPDCRKHQALFPLTFLMCIFWIGSNAYIVSWMVTVIGYTFGIQDSVLGLTFLAAGGCLPEAISITIVAKKGEGAMGVSNALGANTTNILLSLGLPWFIKTLLLVAKEGSSKAQITIVSGSLEYTILALIVVAFVLFATFAMNEFHLSRKSGCILLGFYVCFLALAIVSEMYLFETAEC